MLRDISEFVSGLKLEEKFSPRKNVDIIWFYLFLPSLIGYFVLLTNLINNKPTVGTVHMIDSGLRNLIDSSSLVELITTNLQQTNGPLWIDDESASNSYLMFSDTRLNRIYKWEEGKGLFTVGNTIYIERSGCISNESRCNALDAPGSSGLLRRSTTSLDLLVCQHGEREVTLVSETGRRTAIVTHYKGQRLNAPSDVVVSPEGHLYFTDPVAGLLDRETRSVELDRELGHSGVYMLRAEHVQLALETGEPSPHVLLMDGSLGRPTGLAFSPDYSKLYVSNADAARPLWKVYEVADSGVLTKGAVFADAAALMPQFIGNTCGSEDSSTDSARQGIETCNSAAVAGLPRGLKVDIFGNLFATGPGGVLVLSPTGQLLGRVDLGGSIATNVAFGGDGRLYITAGDVVARVRVKTKPTRIVTAPTSKKI